MDITEEKLKIQEEKITSLEKDMLKGFTTVDQSISRLADNINRIIEHNDKKFEKIETSISNQKKPNWSAIGTVCSVGIVLLGMYIALLKSDIDTKVISNSDRITRTAYQVDTYLVEGTPSVNKDIVRLDNKIKDLEGEIENRAFDRWTRSEDNFRHSLLLDRVERLEENLLFKSNLPHIPALED